MNSIEETVSADEAPLFLASVTDTAYDSQQIESNNRFIRLKFLQYAAKEIRLRQTKCNRLTQAEEFLQRLKQVFKCISFGCRETLNDSSGKRAIKEMFFDLGSFFLQPVDNENLIRSRLNASIPDKNCV